MVDMIVDCNHYTKMLDSLISTSKLVDRTAPLISAPFPSSEADLLAAARRITYWTTASILRAAHGTAVGRGKSRSYALTELPIAAAVMMAAEAGQTVDVLGQAALHLRNMSEPDPLIAGEQLERWLALLSGKAETTFLYAGVGGKREAGAERFRLTQLVPMSKMSDELPSLAAGTYINLTLAFRIAGIL